MNVEYHADLKEVQSDAELARLLSAETQSAPFDRLEWFRLLDEHCGIKPFFAVARDRMGTAVLPLTGREAHLTQASNWYTFRFRPIITLGAEDLLTALACDLSRKARRVTLTGLPTDDAALVMAAFRQAGWLVYRGQSDVNHVLTLAGRNYDAFLAARPGKLRTTLKRKSGKVVTEVLTHFDEAVWASYEDIYGTSWKPEEGSPAFLRAFAQAEGAAGRLRLAIAHSPEGEAIAAQMWTVEGGTAFIHKLAHRESAKPLSPGSVLSAALFRHVIDVDKIAMVDFGTGDDPYKRDWMEEVRPRYRLDLIRPFAPGNWPFIARSAATSLGRALAARAKRG